MRTVMSHQISIAMWDREEVSPPLRRSARLAASATDPLADCDPNTTPLGQCGCSIDVCECRIPHTQGRIGRVFFSSICDANTDEGCSLREAMEIDMDEAQANKEDVDDAEAEVETEETDVEDFYRSSL